MTNPNSDPHSDPQFPDNLLDIEAMEVDRPIFSVGDPMNSADFITNNRRYFVWKRIAHDEELAHIAGWERFFDHTRGQWGILELPQSCRSASSVLSGTEAWAHEKDNVLNFISKYIKAAHAQTGLIDMGLGLDTVGVVRDTGEETQMLVVPPHQLVEATADKVQVWVDGFKADLAEVLRNDPQRDELVGLFAESVSFLHGPGVFDVAS